MIGRPTLIALKTVRIVGRVEDVKLLLADRFPEATVIMRTELRNSRLVVEVLTLKPGELGRAGTTRAVELLISKSVNLGLKSQ